MKRKRKRENADYYDLPQASPEWEEVRLQEFAMGVTSHIMPYLVKAYVTRNEVMKEEMRRLLTWAFHHLDWDAQETWNPVAGTLLLELMKGEEIKFVVRADLTPS